MRAQISTVKGKKKQVGHLTILWAHAPENQPSSSGHNFISTEPILIILDSMESYWSESFISGT